MPVIPRFLTQAQLPKKSGLVQQDPERASFLAGEVADAAVPLAESLEAIMTKGLLNGGGNDPADQVAALNTPVPQPAADDRPPHIANLTDEIYVTGRDRALSRQVRDILVRRATEDDDPASPTFTSGVERAVAEAQQADRADRPAGISDAALLNRERHDAAMRANAVVKAQALQDREVMDRAMAELDASADSLVLASRAGGDLETSFEEVRELGERFTPGLGADVVDNFIANTHRELIEAHVLGLVSRGEIDAAEGVLSQYSGELPDGQATFLERSIESGQEALERAGKSERRQRMLLLTTRAKAGADVGWQADQLAEDGVISPAERRQLARVTRESAERQAERERLIDLAGDAAAGGAPLDAGNREHRLAAELWYAAEGEALFAGLDPEARIDTVAQAVSGLGHVPDDLHRDLVLDLRSADPAVALMASREIAALREAAPAAAGAAFTDGELARAGTVIALDGHGTDTLIPNADALAPVEAPELRTVAAFRPDAGAGKAASGSAVRDALEELTELVSSEASFDEARANALLDAIEPAPTAINAAVLGPLFARLAQLVAKGIKPARRFLERLVRWITVEPDDLTERGTPLLEPPDDSADETDHTPIPLPQESTDEGSTTSTDSTQAEDGASTGGDESGGSSATTGGDGSGADGVSTGSDAPGGSDVATDSDTLSGNGVSTGGESAGGSGVPADGRTSGGGRGGSGGGGLPIDNRTSGGGGGGSGGGGLSTGGGASTGGGQSGANVPLPSVDERKQAFRDAMGLDYQLHLDDANRDRRVSSDDDPLDDEPRTAFNLYTTEKIGSGDSTYLLVNDALRDGTVGEDPRIDAIIDMMDLGVEQLPAFEGEVFRSVDLEPDQEAKLFPGGTWVDPGFMSASLDEARTPRGRKYMFIITTHSGCDIAPYARSDFEQEILIPRGTEFDITSVEPQPDGTIHVELVEKEP
ncbi:MAG: ADP-ribosyltransferase domain-containing protein [Pseudomonadota bacterium]